jgi:hypothetical protein
MKATTYGQQDPPWRNVLLGTSAVTIGGYGCTITALASYLTDVGVEIGTAPPDPGLLNRWLARHGGFWRGNLLIFDSVRPLGVEMIEYIDCRAQPAPIARLQDALLDQRGVLIEVDFRPATRAVNPHWVRLLRLMEDDAWIMDPWLAAGWEITRLMPRYARPDWDTPARAVMRAVIYGERAPAAANDAAARPYRVGAGEAPPPTQEVLCPAPWVEV